MSALVWITGSSSGIGAALVEQVPYADARVIGIARRPHPGAEHLAADLSDPDSWAAVESHIAETLETVRPEAAIFMHFAGTVEGDGPIVDVDPDAYRKAVLLNAASGQVLGRAFLSAVHAAGGAATLVVASSPAGSNPSPGMSHYCAAKAGLEMWTRAVASEVGDDVSVFSVVPYAVDTPMLRTTASRADEDVAIARHLRAAVNAGRLATATSVADEIWTAVENPPAPGAQLAVGATGLASAS